jgi:uncharacterized membrane protein YqiK
MEDLIRDRDKLTSETRTAAGVDMEKLGLIIDSLQIQDIKDPSGYIGAMAAPHVASVQQSARIAQANANQAAVAAEQSALAANAQAERDTQIKQAQYKADVDTAKAKSDQAGPLSTALAQQEVVIAGTKTAQLEADRTEQQLQVSVRKPADAEAYAITVRANANRDAAIAEAQAKARQVELEATAAAGATEVTGKAQATATAVIGQAEGEAIKARALGEAAGIAARADALAKNQDAVIGQTLAENMAGIVREAAGAFSKVDNLTVLNGAQGMNEMMSGVVGMATTLLPMVRSALMKPNPETPQA